MADHAPVPTNSGRHCWLCRNNNTDLAKEIHTFLLQDISTIGVDALTDMIHTRLRQQLPPDQAGTDVVHIRAHIQGAHMLCPSLQIAHILRSLVELKDTLHKMLLTEDEDGVKVVDAKNMAVYVKVISEIMQVYRTGDITKLLFACDEKHTKEGFKNT